MNPLYRMKVNNMKSNQIMKRKRIDQALSNIFDYPLTIVSATMGYGKTSSVRSYLSGNRGAQTVWVSLLGSDGDEAVFWSKLSSAVCRLNPEIGKRLERLGFPSNARQVAAFLEIIEKLNEDANIVLVIDDYHLIEHNDRLNRLVEIVAEEEFPNLHMVLISRTRPRLNYVNLLSKGLCHYIDTETLAFTIQEVRDYFAFMGLADPPENLEEIYRYTRGWISAIYLILLGIRQGLPVTGVSTISQLVGENLYSSLDNEVKEALLDLSVLDCFTADLAVTVAENTETPRMLDRLVGQNAFIEFDRQTGVYKLHNVLLDFLRETSTACGRDLRPACRRAGKWYLEHGELISAFDYYHRAGRIEELLDRLNAIQRLESSYFIGVDLLRVVFGELSPEAYVKYPFPILRMAFSFVLSGDESDVKECEKITAALKAYYSEAADVPETLRNRILGEIEVIGIFRAFNDAPGMVEISLKAGRLLDGGVSNLVFRHNEFTFGLPHFIYAYYREPGEFKKTVECIEKGFPPGVFDGCGTGCAELARAEYALETGDAESAELYARKALYKGKTLSQTGIILSANFTLMRLHLLRGDFAAAKKLLAETREEFLTNPQYEITPQNSVIYNLTMDMCEGYLYGCLNLPGLIPEWLRSGEIEAKPLMMRGAAFPYIVYGKSVLLSQSWAELEVLCEIAEKRYMIFRNRLGLLHNAVYAAVAKYNLYGMEAGIKTLLPALKEAQEDGVLLPFAENAAFILPMLYEIRKADVLDPAYIERLLRLCEQYSRNLAARSPAVRLTGREAEVMELVSQGLTNRQIADRLYLSVAGVKKHLESIYAKLEVSNRAGAVQKAQKEGLLRKN